MGDRSARFRLSFCAVVLLAASSLAAGPLPRPATVGYFTVRLAQSLGFEVKTATDARAALSAAGVTFAGALADPLTEEEAARLLGHIGVAATPSDADRILSEPLAQSLAGLAAHNVLSQEALPASQGSLPPSCQSLARDLCFQCCIASLGRLASVPQRMIDLCSSSCTTLGAPPTSTSTP
jgi:hypothetical protein